MKIFGKILVTTLPLVILFLILMVASTFYLSKDALENLGDIWLDTCVTEALEVVASQDTMLRRYGLEAISASLTKAKMDAAAEMGRVQVGRHGYVFAVDAGGMMVLHPDKYFTNVHVGDEPWFDQLGPGRGRLVLDLGQGEMLARYAYFKPWDWYVVAADPIVEVYGTAQRLKPLLLGLSIAAALVIALALMLLTRRLTRPLTALVQGAARIGQGELDTRIQVRSRDEFGHLAMEFNQMALRLKASLWEVKQREEHFRALIENAADMIWILDQRGRFSYVSPSTERILGYAREDLMDTEVFELAHPSEKEEMCRRFEDRILGVSQTRMMEYRIRHRDGYWCILESISTNLLEHSAVLGYVINSRNITKRKQVEKALKRSYQELEGRVEERTRELLVLNQTLNAEVEIRKQKEAELERANQAKGEFLANMSHEIRTPLNSVIGFSQILDTMIEDPRQSTYVSTILSSGKSLLNLLNEVLDLSKMEAGKLDIKKVPTRLTELFEEVGQMFRVRLQEKSLLLEMDVDRDSGELLLLDDVRLRQMVTNLMDNAIKFTESGHIRVSAQAEPGHGGRLDLTISIQDSGVGIPREKLELIFESFQQESAGTSRKYGGTGLGLAICRQLAQLMGGDIEVESCVGEGSCFKILLPGVAAAGQQGSHSRHRREDIDLAALSFAGQRVLVVDDQDSIRFMMREFLEKVGLVVDEADSGKAALACVNAQIPDLIFIDVKMPDMDGITAARALQGNPAMAQIPLVLVTASTRYALPDEGEDLPFVHCITKPVDLKEMGEVLCRYLGGEWPGVVPATTTPAPRFQPGDMAAHPRLREALRESVLPLLPELQAGMRISDIREVAGRIIELGREHGVEDLSRMGLELRQYADTFDIEKIRHCLQDVEALIRIP